MEIKPIKNKRDYRRALTFPDKQFEYDRDVLGTGGRDARALSAKQESGFARAVCSD